MKTQRIALTLINLIVEYTHWRKGQDLYNCDWKRWKEKGVLTQPVNTTQLCPSSIRKSF